MTEILGILVALKKSQKYPSFPRNLFGFQHLIFSFLTIFFVTFFFGSITVNKRILIVSKAFGTFKAVLTFHLYSSGCLTFTFLL